VIPGRPVTSVVTGSSPGRLASHSVTTPLTCGYADRTGPRDDGHVT
jgi:hypothetical protein